MSSGVMELYEIWRQELNYFWATARLILFNTQHVCTCRCKMFGRSLFSGHSVYRKCVIQLMQASQFTYHQGYIQTKSGQISSHEGRHIIFCGQFSQQIGSKVHIH